MPHATHSVLIVEDDPAFRAGFVYAVRCAADLPEGLRLLDATRPDVLPVDIGLPSGSGIDLIRRASETLPRCVQAAAPSAR